MTAEAPVSTRIARTDPLFARVAAAVFFAGFSTFGALYGVQPLMPEFSRTFAVSPAAASLALSATTAALALSNFAAGAATRRVGRKRLMSVSLMAACVATALGGAASTFPQFVALRALAGVALAGVPAVAMAYLADEIESAGLGAAMGLYISGSTLGGLSGRLVAAVVSDHFGWRAAILAVSALAALGGLWIHVALPTGRGGLRPLTAPVRLSTTLKAHLRDPGLRWLFAEAFLMMGAFVTVYNYIGFRLSAPPFSMSQTAIGLMFSLYLLGALSSTVMGSLASLHGRRKMLWIAAALPPLGVLLTLPDRIEWIVAGVALVTLGFFGAHSIASSWVGLRADGGRTEASALYLFFYYLGSSVVGTLGGGVYGRFGWDGVVFFLILVTAAALMIALRLSTISPPAHIRPGP